MEPQERLQEAINKIEKQFGKGALIKMDSSNIEPMEAISTGSISLDMATGIGGVPKGRIIELYGPESSGKSTLALHMVAECQKQGGKTAYIDAEHSLDPVYAKAIGVNIEDMYVSQPDTGEQALEICSLLAESGGIDLIVIDSVAALVPKAELQGEMGDSHVGLQARLMSQALRKITAVVDKSNVCIVFINQLREKVGVMFGCLHADTMIPFANGESHTIREVVDNKIKGEVWAYDEKNKEFVKREITDWHYNGEVVNNSDYIHITTEALESKGGLCGITVTPDHRVMTEHGWKKAKDITLADRILTQYDSIINGTLGDFLYGTFCGDSHIALRVKNTASLRFQDSNNPKYVDWKISKLSPFFEFKDAEANQFRCKVSKYSSELAIVKSVIGERNPLVLLNGHYSDMGLALWYMDDGHFDNKNGHCRVTISVKRFADNHTILFGIQKAFIKHGLEVGIEPIRGCITFNKENTLKLFEKIYKYIPECMQYKLSNEYKGKYEDFTLSAEHKKAKYYIPIKEIRIASDTQMRQRGKYDITVKDCHNYLAGGISNGILVHNSPEVTTGGKALKFYSSMRFDVRRIETLKEGDRMIGSRTRVKIVKNKCAPPFRTAEFDIMYGKGISAEGDVLDLAVQLGIVKKGGSWYSYKDKRIGQGRENVKKLLSENKELFEEIKSEIRGRHKKA